MVLVKHLCIFRDFSPFISIYRSIYKDRYTRSSGYFRHIFSFFIWCPSWMKMHRCTWIEIYLYLSHLPTYIGKLLMHSAHGIYTFYACAVCSHQKFYTQNGIYVEHQFFFCNVSPFLSVLLMDGKTLLVE